MNENEFAALSKQCKADIENLRTVFERKVNTRPLEDALNPTLIDFLELATLIF
jgi:hypothetical protein